MTRNIKRLIFAVIWITIAELSIATGWYSIWSTGFMEANPNASICWILGLYGPGMGSVSASARMMGYAVVGLLYCVISLLYVKTHSRIRGAN